MRAPLDALYDDLLAIVEEHVTTRPYLFGGLPSIADCVLMGPLFGHLARDPEPAMRMKQKAPRVFRWTEHMNTPEIIWPELFDEPPVFLEGDEIPQTTRSLMRLLIETASERVAIAAQRLEALLRRWGTKLLIAAADQFPGIGDVVRVESDRALRSGPRSIAVTRPS